MKKLLVMLCSMAMAAVSAEPVRPSWSQALMLKTCVDVVSAQVEKESQVGEKVRFEAVRASSQMTTDEAFACLVVGEKWTSGAGREKHELRVYAASVKPWPKLQYRVQEVPLL